MRSLAAFLALLGTAYAQEEGPGERERTVLERIGQLERELDEAKESEEKTRLREELRGLREQAERMRDRRRGPEAPEARERLRARIEELDARLREAPEDVRALMERSELRRRLGDAQGAEEDRAAALKLDPGLRGRPPGAPRGPFQPGAERRHRFGMGEEGRPAPFNPDEARAWLREAEPETYRHVARLEEEGRRPEAMEILREADRRRLEMDELRQRDPRGFERVMEVRRMEGESIAMAERLRGLAPGDASREEGVRKLTDLLNRLFDLREEMRGRELAELRRRMEELERTLAGRKAKKDRIVEKRLRELLGEGVDEDW